MDPSTFYPTETNIDYSPSNDSYTEQSVEAYFAYASTTQLGDPLSMFSDSFVDQLVTSSEFTTGFESESGAVSKATLPAGASANVHSYWVPLFDPATFGHLKSFKASCGSVSPPKNSSTPSLCSDGLQTCRPSSPNGSPCSAKGESPSRTSPEVKPGPKHPRRKRGQPRLDRMPDKVSSASTGCQHTARIQHNKFERKYRAGLNAELERLRRAVPMVLQSGDDIVMGQRKQSKAMVLASAINYIKKIEQERDVLQNENDAFRRVSRSK